MFDIDVIAYCPVCKQTKVYSCGGSTTISYNGNYYSLINCHDCKKTIAATTYPYSNSIFEINNRVKVKNNRNFIPALIRFMVNKRYTDETSEDVIEKEVFEYATEFAGKEFAMENEYEIKDIIQYIMAHSFNIPVINLEGTSYLYSDIKDQSTWVSTTLY